MSQHDFDIANASGAAVRADLNNALVALGGTSIGATAPSTTYAGQRWFDTTANILKIRDAANTNWVNEAQLVGTTWTPYRNGTLLGTAAVETIGTSGSNVPKLDGANTWGAAQTMTLTNPAPPPGHKYGGILSNGTDATNDIDVTAGAWRDAADTANLVWASAIGKQIDVTWAAGGTPGTPTGGMSSSLHPVQNDTWYHVIAGLVSGTVEIGFDTSVTGANLVTDHGFTNTRRLRSVFRGTAANLGDTQNGGYVQWHAPSHDLDITNGGAATKTNFTVAAPADVIVEIWGQAYLADAGDFSVIYFGLDQPDRAPAETDSDINVASSSTRNNTGVKRMVEDSTMAYRQTGTSADEHHFWTHGYFDPRE